MADNHVHDVMQMMIDANTPFTRESLKTAIEAAFGADATFHSCSEDGMGVDTTIEFLEARGKFTPAEGGFTTEAEKMCSH